MGRRSRKRVREGLQPAKLRQARTQGVRDGDAGRAASSDLIQQVQRRFKMALEQFDRGEGAGSTPDLTVLAGWWEDGIGRAANKSPGLVPALVCSYLCGEIEQVWARGWQPADVSRVVDRRLGPKHARLVVQSIAEEAETYRSDRQTLTPWLAQLDQIGAELHWSPAEDHLTHLGIELGLDRRAVLQTAFELLVMLHHLPDIPRFCPPPSEWGRSSALDAAVSWRDQNHQVDVRYLERIRALLAKAESTEFEAEAESLVAKAQELMTRHAIDAALLSAHTAGKRSGERPTGRRIGVEDPYAQAKMHLLSEIGRASRCRTVWSKNFGFATVFGFEGDLISVELLYTSLLLQARNSMTRTGEMGGRTRSRSFRQSFLVGFATRIGRRLEEAADITISDVREEQGSRFLPVLAERSQMVDDLRDETFGDLQQCSSSANDNAGWAMGTTAADLAEISRGPRIDERATA
jgi:hypothetical protein